MDAEDGFIADDAAMHGKAVPGIGRLISARLASPGSDMWRSPFATRDQTNLTGGGRPR
jgi:hypothetical protein